MRSDAASSPSPASTMPLMTSETSSSSNSSLDIFSTELTRRRLPWVVQRSSCNNLKIKYNTFMLTSVPEELSALDIRQSYIIIEVLCAICTIFQSKYLIYNSLQ